MKIVFTSCMDAERVADQEIWRRIAEHEQPDVLMLLGDHIYMDWGLGPGARDWRSLIAREPVQGLRAYAIDMHRRYALQWGVQAFRDMVCGFAGRSDPARLLLTWDDHDYAWNNSLGVDGTGDAYRHGVPERVKAVSRRLWAQFEHQLREAAVDAAYPAGLPPDWDSPLPAGVGDLFWSGALGAEDGPTCLLLDTRWHRQARAPGASLLGVEQARALRDAAGEPGAGLLLVAAGTPMAHHYLLSQQGWHAEGGHSYAEYDGTLRAARRPVLFLGGDVHANVWSGRLPASDGASSRVVQVLSSGAAIGRYGPQRFAPSYGVATVPETWRTGGVVEVQLWAQSRGGAWEPDPPMPPLPFDAGDWTEPLQAQAHSRVDAAADDHPVAVLAARTRSGAFRDRTQVSLPQGLDGLDAVYLDEPMQDGHYAEPVHWCVAADGSARLEGEADMGRPGDWPAATYRLVQSAFDRALAQPEKTAVVLFIHGFGKSPAMGLEQAYGLRAVYPACEPVLYGWEAGRGGGVLAALSGVPRARQGAQGGSFALATVLHAFNTVAAQPAYAGLAKVVLARSAGCLALHHALERMGVGGHRLANLNRIVLSAPMLKASEYRRQAGLGGLELPVVMTRNRHDQTLRFADWFDGAGALLGVDEDFVPARQGHSCLDFSDSAGVGPQHDYLLLRINPQQHRLHETLLCQRDFAWSDAVAEGLVSAAGAGVFDVP
ncbi:alkaline phosphatase D family protein [Acidovorax sp. NPDC077693]|uniref:alkaline phosphatase D family protein n=1 Tax=unclassified Acidovorax TaxID=2684926 RepID=UPI0037C9FACC